MLWWTLSVCPLCSWLNSFWYPRKKTLWKLVQRTPAHHPCIDHHGVHGRKILALVSLAAAVFGTLLRVGESQTALVAFKFRQIWAWACPAGIRASANISRAVWRVVQAVVLAPDIHRSPKGLVCNCCNAHLAADYQRSLTILCCCIPDHNCTRIVCGRKKPRWTNNTHVCAVPKSLLGAATQACSSVSTVAPRICRSPSPLEHASLTGQTSRKSCFSSQQKLVFSFQYREFLFSIQLSEGVLVQTLLCCLLTASPHRTELECEPALVIGGQLHFQLYHRVFDVSFGDHRIAVIASSFMVLRTWFIVSIPTNPTPVHRFW